MRLSLIVVVLASMLCGCGGASSPVPDVVGERLDVAKSQVKDAGYDTEEIGGGTFGIVVESNWTVCETDPPAGQAGADKVKLVVDRSCPASESSAGANEPNVESTAAEPAPTPARKKRKRHRAVASIVVPNVIGMDHQAAQNRMQAAGLYNLRERDGTGQGRLLLWDRNWVVIDQRPVPGSRADETAKVTLVSVKDGEQ
jgi:beta-lactam-binding protein with PASTA domain